YKEPWMGGAVHVGHLWSADGTPLAAATFADETASGWQQVTLSSPVAVAANTAYVVSFSSGGGYFGWTGGYFASGYAVGPLSAPAGAGVYQAAAGAFPSQGGGGRNFWADVAFSPSGPADPPAAPTGLTATASSSGEVDLGWAG